MYTQKQISQKGIETGNAFDNDSKASNKELTDLKTESGDAFLCCESIDLENNYVSPVPVSGPLYKWAVGIAGYLDNGTESDLDIHGQCVAIEHAFVDAGIEIAKQLAILTGVSKLIHFFDCDLQEMEKHMKQTDHTETKMIYLDMAKWMNQLEEDEDEKKTRDKFIELVKQNKKNKKVILVLCVEDLKDLHESIVKVGLFDRLFSVESASAIHTANWLVHNLGESRLAEEVLCNGGNEKLGILINRFFRSYSCRKKAVLQLKRTYNELGRPLSFIDVISLCNNGGVDTTRELTTDSDFTRRVAWHEAGHAVISIINSDKKTFPEMITIIPNHNSYGAMIDSVDEKFFENKVVTLNDVRSQIKTLLGGRVAEEVIYGFSNVSSASGHDLECATRLACYSVKKWGFAIGNQKPETWSSLLVLGEENAASYRGKVNLFANRLLQDAYTEALQQIKVNTKLLKMIYERLIKKTVLLSADTEEIVRNCYMQNTNIELIKSA